MMWKTIKNINGDMMWKTIKNINGDMMWKTWKNINAYLKNSERYIRSLIPNISFLGGLYLAKSTIVKI